MKGHHPEPHVTVLRAFAQTRLSEDLLAQAYDHALHSVQQTTSQQAPATPAARRRKRASRVATTTGGRTS
jgi:hypothetical protein